MKSLQSLQKDAVERFADKYNDLAISIEREWGPESEENKSFDSIESFLTSEIALAVEAGANMARKYIEAKNEKVTPHLWYVSNECLESMDAYFAPLSDQATAHEKFLTKTV